MSKLIRRIFGALAAGSLIGLVLVGAPTTAGADNGGPVVLMGIDAEDHGPDPTYATIFGNVFSNVTNGSSTVLVLGGGKEDDDDVTAFYEDLFSDPNPVHTVTFAHDADLATVSLAGYGLIIVASSEEETSWGGLTDDESEALALRSPEFATHVNGGGGLISFSQSGQTTPYGFLGDVGNFVRDDIDFGDDTDIDVTPAGTAAGLSDALDICCWHDEYLEFPSFLAALATYATDGTAEVAAVGGAKVLIPTGIELTPATQSIAPGGTCTVTATVMEDNEPVADVPVSFSVTSGPKAGTTGSGTTNADGQATFSFVEPAEGVDTIGASFTDSLERVREATPVTCTAKAVQVLGNTVTQAPTPAPNPGPAPSATPVAAAPSFTG